MVLLLATASLGSADKVAAGLEARPFPYFLALVIVALMVLWGTLVTVAWRGAKDQARLHETNYRRELERAQELKRERDETRELLHRERSEHLKLTIEVLTTAKGLSRVREELDKEALDVAEAKARRKRTPTGGG
jgi:hypothetical protein